MGVFYNAPEPTRGNWSALDLIMSIQLGRVSNYPCLIFDIAGAGVVFCQERGADLHMTQLTPLPLTVSCFNKIQTDFTFLVPAHPGGPRTKGR